MSKSTARNTSLIDNEGLPTFGQFDAPPTDLGVNRFRYFNSMDKPASFLSKYFHYKQFQFVSINTGQYLIGVAIADIRYLGNGFIYVYDKARNTLIEQSWLRPANFGYQVSASPTSGKAFIGSAKSHTAINIQNGAWQLIVKTATITCDVVLTPNKASLPLSMCSPTGYNGWTYTQKHNALSVEGVLIINNAEVNLERTLAGYDFSAGYMRRETSWRWASINHHLKEGAFGLNLAEGVNETGGSENVYWLNGVRHYLPAVHFSFERQRSQQFNSKCWHISSVESNNGLPQIELEFIPLNSRAEKLNFWLLKSNFRQFIGHYNGVIRCNDGKNIELKNVLGLSEDHFARW